MARPWRRCGRGPGATAAGSLRAAHGDATRLDLALVHPQGRSVQRRVVYQVEQLIARPRERDCGAVDRTGREGQASASGTTEVPAVDPSLCLLVVPAAEELGVLDVGIEGIGRGVDHVRIVGRVAR